MRRRLLYSVVFLLALSLCARGQTTKFVGIETGFDLIDVHGTDQSYIRNDRPTDFGGFSFAPERHQNTFGKMYRKFVGAKMEVRSFQDRLAVSTGLRFTQLITSLSSENVPDYFYFMNPPVGTTTQFYRVSEIKQTSNFLSVPLEVRYFPFRPRKVRVYFMLGGEFGYRLTTHNQIYFYSPAMDSYKGQVSNVVGKPANYYSTLYTGIGFMVGGKDKPQFGLDITGLPMLIRVNSTNLVRPSELPLALGVHFQVLVPLTFFAHEKNIHSDH